MSYVIDTSKTYVIDTSTCSGPCRPMTYVYSRVSKGHVYVVVHSCQAGVVLATYYVIVCMQECTVVMAT